MEKKSGHSLFEDIITIICSIIIFSTGIAILQSAGIITGGITGIAMGISYVSKIDFGTVYIIISIPLFIVSFFKTGFRFTIATILTIVISSIIVDNLGKFLEFHVHSQLIAAIFGGIIVGMGLLGLARHRASVGGLYIIGVYLQDKNIMHMGKFVIICDILIMLIGIYYLGLHAILYSSITTIIYNIFLLINHKPGRYLPNEYS